MYRTITPVAEITPASKGWTAKVLVMRKLSPRQSQTTGKKYQRFLLIDKDETQVQAVSYGADVSVMEHVLQLQETYFISNAKFQFIQPHWQMIPKNYQWVISRTTAITLDKTDCLPKELGAPRFTKFTDIPLFVNTKTMIDILAVVVDKLDQKTVNINPAFQSSTVQELVIVNEEKIPMLLSIWNELITSEGAAVHNTTEKMPIIAATRLIATNYKGTSLSARGSANIVINPPYAECQYLRSWRTKNHSFLYELARDKKYLNRPTPQSVVPHDNFSSVATVITNNTDDKFWVKVHIEITDEQQRFWYMACNACLKSTSGQYEWKIMCNFCNTETIAKPRAKLVVTVSDNSTPLDVMLFGELAEIILGMPALQIMKLDDEDQKIDCININKDLQHKEFIIQIKKRRTESHFGIEYRYTVISLVQADQLPLKPEIGAGSVDISEASQSSQIEHPSMD